MPTPYIPPNSSSRRHYQSYRPTSHEDRLRIDTLNRLGNSHSSNDITYILNNYKVKVLRPEIKVLNKAITQYGIHGDIASSRAVFDSIPNEEKTVYTYYNLLTQLEKTGKFKDVLSIYNSPSLQQKLSQNPPSFCDDVNRTLNNIRIIHNRCEQELTL